MPAIAHSFGISLPTRFLPLSHFTCPATQNRLPCLPKNPKIEKWATSGNFGQRRNVLRSGAEQNVARSTQQASNAPAFGSGAGRSAPLRERCDLRAPPRTRTVPRRRTVRHPPLSGRSPPETRVPNPDPLCRVPPLGPSPSLRLFAFRLFAFSISIAALAAPLPHICRFSAACGNPESRLSGPLRGLLGKNDLAPLPLS